MVTMDFLKLVPPHPRQTNFMLNKEPLELINAKHGLPLKNLDHLPQMKKHS